jgi:hypothetical protein
MIPSLRKDGGIARVRRLLLHDETLFESFPVRPHPLLQGLNHLSGQRAVLSWYKGRQRITPRP